MAFRLRVESRSAQRLASLDGEWREERSSPDFRSGRMRFSQSPERLACHGAPRRMRPMLGVETGAAVFPIGGDEGTSSCCGPASVSCTASTGPPVRSRPTFTWSVDAQLLMGW